MYREHSARPGLNQIVACTWQHVSRQAARARVLPDACVDIVWDGSRLRLAGPDTRAVHHALPAGTHILGLRFVPGAASALLGLPASAVRDVQVDLRELWGDRARRLEERLRAAAGPQAGLRALEASVLQRLQVAGPVDPLIRSLVRRLSASPACAVSIAQLSAALGLSERQLRRRCESALGYGPKLLARVLRFQAFMGALRARSPRALAELALQCGYADQAHLAHDSMQLSGATPGQLRAELLVCRSA